MTTKKMSRPGGKPERDDINLTSQNYNKNVDSESTLETTLQYAILGWPVLPIHSARYGQCSCQKKDCKSPGKHPRTKKGLKDASIDPKIIQEWWERWPDCNIAIVTGKLSGLAVLDIDVKNSGFESLDLLMQEFGDLPKSLIAETGGDGRHYFFKCPTGGFKNSAGKIAPGIDTRGDGGYVVVAPSIHKSGKPYIWKPNNPTEIELAEVPGWVLDKLSRKKITPKSTIGKSDHNGVISEGGRNDTLTSLAGSMRRAGFEQSSIEAALLEHNRKKCNPPLTEEEVKKIAVSISRPEYAPNQKENGKSPSQSQTLIGLANGSEFFHDVEGESYATIQVDNHRENWRVRGNGFKGWLLNRFYNTTRKAPSAQAVTDALGVLDAKGRFDGKEQKCFTRVAGSDVNFYIDLCDKNWQAVEITCGGWRVISDPPVKFIRSKGMIPLPIPVTGGSVDELLPLINIADGEWPLVVGFLIAALKPSGPYPILVLQGEQGSAKSTFARLVRSLVDPSTAPLRTIQQDERDLLISAQNSWCLTFDNLSGLTSRLSDAFCRLSTGGGFATRQLYSNAEETLFDSQRPLILNGIDNLTARGDLRDRALIINLPMIPQGKRRDEKSLLHDFEKVRPRIFGALLDAVSCALKNATNVELENLPRMADFAKWITASEPALGWKPGTFMGVYKENISAAVDTGLENDVIGQAILDLIEDEGRWKGTCTDLLAALAKIFSDKFHRTKSWPQTPAALSNRLRRLAPSLRQVNVEVEFIREGTAGRRFVTIRKYKGKTVSTVSIVKVEDIPFENKLGEKGSDGSDGTDDDLDIFS